MNTNAIGSRLALTILLTIFLLACNSDKRLFLDAEQNYNMGNLEASINMYKRHIKDYPASQYRTVAERQLEKAKQLFILKEQAKNYTKSNDFQKARRVYHQILQINTNVIDSLKVFELLTTKEQLHDLAIDIQGMETKYLHSIDDGLHNKLNTLLDSVFALTAKLDLGYVNPSDIEVSRLIWELLFLENAPKLKALDLTKELDGAVSFLYSRENYKIIVANNSRYHLYIRPWFSSFNKYTLARKSSVYEIYLRPNQTTIIQLSPGQEPTHQPGLRYAAILDRKVKQLRSDVWGKVNLWDIHHD